MTNEEAKLAIDKTGVYKIFWKGYAPTSYSLASVGVMADGTLWYAPSNWTSEMDPPIVASIDWSVIERVEYIDPQGMDKLKVEIEALQGILADAREDSRAYQSGFNVATTMLSKPYWVIRLHRPLHPYVDITGFSSEVAAVNHAMEEADRCREPGWRYTVVKMYELPGRSFISTGK